MQTLEMRLWRRLLRLGGRAPGDAILVCRHLPSIDLELRARRLAFFLRLIHSPMQSWQHMAFIVQKNMQTDWYKQCLRDLRQVLPQVRLEVGMHTHGLFVFDHGFFDESDFWKSSQPYSFPLDQLGRRHRIRAPRSADDPLELAMRKHVKNILSMFRRLLSRQFEAELFWRIRNNVLEAPESKLQLLAVKLVQPGPPLHVVLNWIPVCNHRNAVLGLFAGDFFLGRYAGNYFGKQLLPRSLRKKWELSSLGLDHHRICLSCWVERDSIWYEDELHVLFSCPAYDNARQDFIGELQECARSTLMAATSENKKLEAILSSTH
eukprot:1311658-Karenia_brevis.AAC.1